MDEKQKKKINRGVVIATSIMAAMVLGYIIYVLAVKKTIGIGYYAVIITFLVVYWLLTNVLETVLTKELQGKTEAQVRAYKIYALLNLVGLAGLGFFAIAIGDNNGMIGALIYVAAMMAKRRFWEEYMGIVKEADREDTEEPADTEQLQAGKAEEPDEERQQAEKETEEPDKEQP